ncbi:MAG: hypothetical protein ACKESB_03495 [Candidatus Hodgkinia cicadicola]
MFNGLNSRRRGGCNTSKVVAPLVGGVGRGLTDVHSSFKNRFYHRNYDMRVRLTAGGWGSGEGG